MARIPSRVAAAIRDKYQIKNNAFTRAVKDDPRDRLEVEVGDAKQPDTFYPQLKIMRWDNEVNFSCRLKDEDYTMPQVRTQGENIKWVSAKREVHFYDLPESEEHPEGGYEFEVVLKEKPITNVVELSIETKGLEFFYQPELTQEEIDQGCIRPDNVVNSYAVYYKDCPANYKGGKLYRVGKAFHIYRIKATDAQGNWTWCDQQIDVETKTHRLIIPQEFLDKAVYPVIVDSTFGYSGTPGSIKSVGNGKIEAYRYTGAAGTTTHLSVYSGNSLNNFQLGIYDLSLNLVGYSSTGSQNYDYSYVTVAIASGGSLSNADYYLGYNSSSSGRIGYDVGTSNYYFSYTTAYGSWPASVSPDTWSLYRLGIYCTYTAGGGTDITVNVPSALSATFSTPTATITTTQNVSVSAGVLALTFSLPDPTVTAVSPTVYIYNAFKKNIANGSIDLSGANLKIMLVTSSYTFDQDAHEYVSDITNEVTGDGYTSGGASLANPSVTTDNTNNLAYFDTDDVTWSGATITFRGAIIYQNTGNAATSPLVCFLDFKSDQTASSENVTLQWNEGGILKLS